MPHEVNGVVASEKGAPVSITTVVVPDPGPGEALVSVQACGVCHTAASATTSRICSATRRRVSSRRSAQT
jgi:Zn-dependent alcohol dehydrogenase